MEIPPVKTVKQNKNDMKSRTLFALLIEIKKELEESPREQNASNQ
jgi:hypothetical protein